MAELTDYLDACNLTAIHSIASLFGVLMCLYVAQITSHFQEDKSDPWLLQQATRIALFVLALTFLWQFMYSYNTGWQPWPPAIAMNIAIDFALVVRAFAVKLAQKRRAFDKFPVGQRRVSSN